jgi:arsenate reductase
MDAPIRHVLFLCTGNSARSVMAEALLNVLGKGRYVAHSAGSHPAGAVQPMAEALARKFGYAGELRSKNWDEFAQPDMPAMDIVITVCDNAAGEVCPVWPGHPVNAHWGVPDPVAVEGDEDTRRHAYLTAWSMLRRRIELMLALPVDKLERMALQDALRGIGREGEKA